MTVGHSNVEQESVFRCKRGKSAQQSPSHTTSPGVGHETKTNKISSLYVADNFFY